MSKWILRSAILLPLVGLMPFVASAEAKTRFTVEYLFEEIAPPAPESYFFDEEYTDEHGDGVIVYERVPRRNLALPYDDFDPDYYEPRIEKPKLEKRKATVKEKLQKPKIAVKPDPGAEDGSVAAIEPEQKIKPAKPKVEPSKETAKITCEKGVDVVKGYGFSDVKTKSCEGKTYAFTGTRSGKNYEITISPGNGALTEVKRI